MPDMKKPVYNFLFAVLALLLSGLACNFSASTANIGDAWMSTDEAGNSRTTVFGPDAIFFAQVDLKNAPDDTMVKVVWIAVEVDGTEPNFQMNETELQSGDGVLLFRLSNDGLWPHGKYRADIYLNGALVQSLTFEVR